ncbi:MAG TPA: hypothetical protein VFB20_06310 [Burkholderiales bacterium]|nr:hypothetical protein [Burkholderiales bacterium]
MVRLKTMVWCAALLGGMPAAFAVEYEYQGYCTEGLAEGVKLHTDCSIVWTSPDGRNYCFSTPDAKDKFLASPHDNLVRAQAFWKDPEFWKALNKQRAEEEKAKRKL